MFLSREELFERSLGGESRENEIPHWLGNLCFPVVSLILKACFRYRVDNRDTLRSFAGKSGVVVLCNHTSYLDVAFLWCAVRPSQWIRLMARDTLFETGRGLGGQFIARAGAFPVKRDSADLTSLKRAARMLKNKEIVGIFPEGTRRGKGSQVPQLHAGAALVAKMGKAPLLPCTVRNAEKIKVKGERIRFPKVSIEFGQPVRLSDFDALPKAERLEACTWFVMRECFALSQNCAPEEVDMAALFPETKDYSDELSQLTFDRSLPGSSTVVSGDVR